MKLVKDLGTQLCTGNRRRRKGIYRCPSCGDEREYLTDSVKQNMKTCKECIPKQFKRTHGLSGHKGRSIYKNMMSRCYNPKDKSYTDYGKRGITVSRIWQNLNSFLRWYDSQTIPKGYQLDRRDNNLGYYPSNCRFISPAKNSKNKRNSLAVQSEEPYVTYNPINNWKVRIPKSKTRGNTEEIRLGTFVEEADAIVTKRDYFDTKGWDY